MSGQARPRHRAPGLGLVSDSELVGDPELIAIAALELAIYAAQTALRTFEPGLGDERPEHLSTIARDPVAWSARSVLVLSEHLNDQLRYYRFLRRQRR